MTAPRWRMTPLDVALAAATCVLVLLPADQQLWARVAAVLAGVALLFRRRWPRLVLLAAFPATVGGLGLVPAALALHAVGRRLSRPRDCWPWVLATFAAMMTPAFVATPQFGSPGAGDWILTVLLVGATATAPAVIGALQVTRSELTARVAELRRAEADRDLAVTAQATVEERNRIAREVHDIVAHYASLIAVQASGLQARATDPETAATAQRLRELSGSALDEMRAAVQLWSADTPLEPPIPESWPAWVLLPALDAQQAGVPLSTDVANELPRPDAVELRVLRRMVQEGVANAVHHGSGPVSVSLAADGSSVVLQVRNPIDEPAVGARRAGGRGLIGLQERVAQVGGTVRAEPEQPARGRSAHWVLRATVPAQPASTGGGVAAVAERRNGSSA